MPSSAHAVSALYDMAVLQLWMSCRYTKLYIVENRTRTYSLRQIVRWLALVVIRIVYRGQMHTSGAAPQLAPIRPRIGGIELPVFVCRVLWCLGAARRSTVQSQDRVAQAQRLLYDGRADVAVGAYDGDTESCAGRGDEQGEVERHGRWGRWV